MSSHKEFFSTWKLLDRPNHTAFIRDIFDGAHIRLKHRRIYIDWNWDDNVDVVGNAFLLELRPGFDDKFNFRFIAVFYSCFHPNKRLNMRINPISHQLKFTIRRYECYQSLALKFVQPYALMKFDILQINKFTSSLFSS